MRWKARARASERLRRRRRFAGNAVALGVLYGAAVGLAFVLAAALVGI